MPAAVSSVVQEHERIAVLEIIDQRRRTSRSYFLARDWRHARTGEGALGSECRGEVRCVRECRLQQCDVRFDLGDILRAALRVGVHALEETRGFVEHHARLAIAKRDDLGQMGAERRAQRRISPGARHEPHGRPRALHVELREHLAVALTAGLELTWAPSQRPITNDVARGTAARTQALAQASRSAQRGVEVAATSASALAAPLAQAIANSGATPIAITIGRRQVASAVALTQTRSLTAAGTSARAPTATIDLGGLGTQANFRIAGAAASARQTYHATRGDLGRRAFCIALALAREAQVCVRPAARRNVVPGQRRRRRDRRQRECASTLQLVHSHLRGRAQRGEIAAGRDQFAREALSRAPEL